jgi:transposase
MGAPYSQDLRARVLAACDGGMKTKQVATVFGVCCSWVRRIKQRRREGGETMPRPMGGARAVKIDPRRLADLVRQRPDATLAELARALGGVCGAPALSQALRRLGLSFKKRRSTRRSRTAPTWPRRGRGGATRSRAATRGG